ncbi:YtrH family sporulation protein [Aneurinibacillus terranovensis]|uniref:YtrH family sporulation protein n=1 Tax=Aneurinibacillus terranovensis TaxID=278991 RepID=UPI0004117172|nr:YtrH family sporulation protein [Aneurinibacillus terranovensis]
MGYLAIIKLISDVTTNFFVAFGIVLGGSVLGGFAAFLIHKPPLNTMLNLSTHLKIWGLVGALGGTFDSFMQIERVFEEGNISPIIKQIIWIISAFVGAHTSTLLIKWFVQGET